MDVDTLLTLTYAPHQCQPLNRPLDAAAAQPVAQMEGQWWATYGYNAVYDCFLCQRLTFSPLNASAWLYDSKYVAVTLEQNLREFEVQAAFPWPQDGTAQAITFTYEYQGMTHGACCGMEGKGEKGGFGCRFG